MAIGWTQADLAKRVGRSKTWVSFVENDENPITEKPITPTPKNIQAIVRAFKSAGLSISLREAYEAAGIPIPDAPVDEPPSTDGDGPDPLAQSIEKLGLRILDDSDIIGGVPASDPDRRTQEHRGTVLQKFGAQYMVEVEGDSMEPYYGNGDILVVRKIQEPDPGDVVIALVYGDSVCKLFTAWKFDPITGETIYTLSPTNHKYREIRASDVEFQGVVVGKFEPARRIRWKARTEDKEEP
ncbi:MAG: LexA family transcriptional regulator [Armatimonadetes bacterium]|nr:LexA family transcriptional regulator [Armatimonadota bacterium]